VELVYHEHYPRIDLAFKREKQVQGWERRKKQALISGQPGLLPELARAYRDVRGLRGASRCLSASPQPPVPLRTVRDAFEDAGG
jgi:putative endonuclease